LLCFWGLLILRRHGGYPSNQHAVREASFSVIFVVFDPVGSPSFIH